MEPQHPPLYEQKTHSRCRAIQSGYAPVASADSLRFQLGYSAALNFIVRSYDCTNAFQCTYEPDARKRVYCRLPPLYLQWYNYRYSWDSLESTDGPFVLQAGQVIQGTPHAGYSWYINIHKRLCLHEYKRNSTDMGFYVKYINGEIVAMMSLTVDDCLFTVRSHKDETHFHSFMSDAYEVTSPGNQPVLKFLSTRIVISPLGISLNQTQHIQQKILHTWFPVNTSAKSITTPFDPNPEFECTLGTTKALSDKDLQSFETAYHGEFRHTIGQLLHIQQWTRADISFSVASLASFNNSPNAPAFQGLKRVMI